ncbi:hypothetical protein CLF_103531 [Clonorchis sinensis]|uniref:Uncharacterized protein n=1 Tax=Clonorchis sinensis TaxID=79923 RepID=G7Y9X7_CLOSI|nr:hypothetical protein CLF_103531 [Clonorchis sinensis]
MREFLFLNGFVRLTFPVGNTHLVKCDVDAQSCHIIPIIVSSETKALEPLRGRFHTNLLDLSLGLSHFRGLSLCTTRKSITFCTVHVPACLLSPTHSFNSLFSRHNIDIDPYAILRSRTLRRRASNMPKVFSGGLKTKASKMREHIEHQSSNKEEGSVCHRSAQTSVKSRTDIVRNNIAKEADNSFEEVGKPASLPARQTDDTSIPQTKQLYERDTYSAPEYIQGGSVNRAIDISRYRTASFGHPNEKSFYSEYIQEIHVMDILSYLDLHRHEIREGDSVLVPQSALEQYDEMACEPGSSSYYLEPFYMAIVEDGYERRCAKKGATCFEGSDTAIQSIRCNILSPSNEGGVNLFQKQLLQKAVTTLLIDGQPSWSQLVNNKLPVHEAMFSVVSLLTVRVIPFENEHAGRIQAKSDSLPTFQKDALKRIIPNVHTFGYQEKFSAGQLYKVRPNAAVWIPSWLVTKLSQKRQSSVSAKNLPDDFGKDAREFTPTENLRCDALPIKPFHSLLPHAHGDTTLSPIKADYTTQQMEEMAENIQPACNKTFSESIPLSSSSGDDGEQDQPPGVVEKTWSLSKFEDTEGRRIYREFRNAFKSVDRTSAFKIKGIDWPGSQHRQSQKPERPHWKYWGHKPIPDLLDPPFHEPYRDNPDRRYATIATDIVGRPDVHFSSVSSRPMQPFNYRDSTRIHLALREPSTFLADSRSEWQRSTPSVRSPIRSYAQEGVSKYGSDFSHLITYNVAVPKDIPRIIHDRNNILEPPVSDF